eukprot:1175463-Prorocentrum_minimum.AAC.1
MEESARHAGGIRESGRVSRVVGSYRSRSSNGCGPTTQAVAVPAVYSLSQWSASASGTLLRGMHYRVLKNKRSRAGNFCRPIGGRNRGYVFTTDQSNAGSVGRVPFAGDPKSGLRRPSFRGPQIGEIGEMGHEIGEIGPKFGEIGPGIGIIGPDQLVPKVSPADPPNPRGLWR